MTTALDDYRHRIAEEGGEVATPQPAPSPRLGESRLTRVVFWRHGRTAWNQAGRVQGQLDIDLDEVGLAQVEQAAPRAVAYRPDLVICSDLARARQTAAGLVALTGVPVEYDDRLRERFFGQWQGLTQDEIRQRYPAEYARWGAWSASIELEFIETIQDLAKRMAAVAREAAQRVGPGGTALLVSHGAAIRAGITEVLGWPEDVAATLGGIYNCHFAELGLNPTRGWHLRAYNVP